MAAPKIAGLRGDKRKRRSYLCLCCGLWLVDKAHYVEEFDT